MYIYILYISIYLSIYLNTDTYAHYAAYTHHQCAQVSHPQKFPQPVRQHVHSLQHPWEPSRGWVCECYPSGDIHGMVLQERYPFTSAWECEGIWGRPHGWVCRTAWVRACADYMQAHGCGSARGPSAKVTYLPDVLFALHIIYIFFFIFISKLSLLINMYTYWCIHPFLGFKENISKLHHDLIPVQGMISSWKPQCLR